MAAPTGMAVLREETLGQMFERQYQTAPELPAMGLAFFRADIDGHRVLSHDGILPGFNAHLAVAPDDGVAVIALTNGSSGAMRWLPSRWTACSGLARRAEAIAEGGSRAAAPGRGRYLRYYVLPEPGDLRGRLAMAGGLQVFLRTVVRCSGSDAGPALWRGLPLEVTPTIPVHSDWTIGVRFGRGGGCTSASICNRVASSCTPTSVASRSRSSSGISPRKVPVPIDRLGVETS